MKKKIVLFIPSIEGGGVEKNFLIIANYLSEKHKVIYIITADKKYKSYFKKNIKVICPKSSIWENKNRFQKTLISIFLLIKNFKKNEIVILSLQSNILSILFSKIFGHKILIRLNTSLKKYISGTLKKYLFKHFYNYADKIIVNSKYFKAELKNLLNLESELIYNFNKSTKKKKKLNFFKNFNGLKILNIGRLTDQKDQIVLLKSLKLLSQKNILFRCCIIGTGIKRDMLQNYIDKQNLNNSIKLLGYKRNAEIYLDFCNLFILTSKYEGLPNVLIEAQSRNIPIISSDCPTGPREILLNGKLGNLFKVGNYSKLSSLIYNFIKNKKILNQKSKKAKKYLKRFELKKNCEKYNKLILEYL